MDDSQYIEKLEEERDTLVDQNFIGEQEIQLRRSSAYRIGEIKRENERRNIKVDSEETIKINKAFGKMLDEARRKQLMNK